METLTQSFAQLSDQELLAEVQRLAACERHATVQLIASLMEVDSRRLYLGEGCSSLFTYCTRVLHLSEHAAYGRIEAARAARRFRRILELLADGALTLTAVGLLAPHLTADNHGNVLTAARHKTKREIEQLIAVLHPWADVPSSVRKLPAPKPRVLPPAGGAEVSHASQPDATLSNGHVVAQPSTQSAPKPAPVVAPLAPERYKVQFTVSRETYDKLRQAQDLLRHTVPNADPAAIFDRALTVLVTDLQRKRLASAERPQRSRSMAPSSRHIPAAVKREVWRRDSGRCAFVGARGRCTETGFLEFHHVVPYARGGPAVADNIELRCAAHNAYEAELCFGRRQPALVREAAPLYALT